MTERFAFRMKLHAGCEAEYRRRHEAIWPELSDALQAAGIRDYTIWLDRESGFLFGLMHLVEGHTLAELPRLPIMKKWWSYMAELMETNADDSPVVEELEPVFFME